MRRLVIRSIVVAVPLSFNLGISATKKHAETADNNKSAKNFSLEYLSSRRATGCFFELSSSEAESSS